jgi:rhodanese-related sulfurtransferase
MKYKALILMGLIISGLLFFQKSKAQFPKSASCLDPEFDKKVNSYLSYSVPVIDVREAFTNKNKFTFLDAREWKEYEVSHIEGAVYVGYDDFDFSRIKHLPKDSPILVYCSIGYRSEKIAEKLKKKGFTKVYNLYGSIFEWANQGYPLISGTKPVQRIHTYNQKWSRWVTRPSIEKVH